VYKNWNWLLKFTKSCKNARKNEIYLQEIYQSSNQEMFAISLSSCSRYKANFKLDQSVSAIHDSPPYFWDQWGWPPTHRYRRPRLLTHTWRRRGLHDKSKMAVQQGKNTIDSITKIRIFAVFAVALFRNLFGQILW
jgi:hypothetical protein